MTELILSLPTWAGSVVAMVLTAVAGLVVYVVSYRLISKYRSDDPKEPISSLFRMVGLLISLMLSLAFADVVIELRAIENAIEREAVAISDTFYDLQLFDSEKARASQAILLNYAQAVIDDDWPALANDKLGQRADVLRRQLSESVLDLEPATSVQEKLWSRVLADVDAISDYRLIRLDNALAQPPVYLTVIIFGFLLTMACFGVYRPQAAVVPLVSLYTFFVGFVLYLILALSDPFQGGIGVSPTTFEYLVETLTSDNR